MLPKVAGQILHHTSRAVAVIQNQTGSTFRNVLHTGPPTTLGGRPGSGSNNSGWGGAAEPGGPKTHTGSRFHSSFAVSSSTQPISSTINVLYSELCSSRCTCRSLSKQCRQCRLVRRSLRFDNSHCFSSRRSHQPSATIIYPFTRCSEG